MNAKKKKVLKEGKISTFDLKKDFLEKQYIHSKTAHFAFVFRLLKPPYHTFLIDSHIKTTSTRTG